MVSNQKSQSNKKPQAKLAASVKKKAPADQPTPVLDVGTKPRLEEVKAPLSFKGKILLANIGKTFWRLVNWYAGLTEVSRDDAMERYRKRGMAEFENGRFADAAENFAVLVQLEPTDPWAYYMLGCSLSQAGDITKGIQWLSRAAERDGDDPEIHFQLGLLLSQEEQLEEAEAEFSKVAALAPAEPKGWYRLGVIYDKMCEHDKAIKSLHRALELRPQSPKVNQRLGFVYEGKGDRAQALQYFKKAAELENSAL